MQPKTITIAVEDAAQVRAILLTHAEMQDQTSVRSEAVLARLKADQADSDMIEDLEESIADTITDSDNLKRLANLFT